MTEAPASAKPTAKSDERLLKEIRENFQYASEAWRENRREGDIDMRIIAGKPWDAKDIEARGKDRPALVFDEITQRLNQVVNNVRQNPRGVEVSPKSATTDGKASERRAGLIRGIEYASDAQYVYALMYESSTSRGEGYLRVNKQRVSVRSFDKELRIEAIPNPCSVYIDPDARKMAASDMRWAFVIDSVRRSEFKRRHPKAQITNFSSEMVSSYPAWIKEDSIQVAEYWCIKHRKDRLLGLASQVTLLESELAERGLRFDGKSSVITETGMTVPVDQIEEVEIPSVVQYHTNGIEILSTTPWEGKYIPIVPCWGRTYYYDDGSGIKFVVSGLIRTARDPIKMLNYYRSTEAELISQLPKAPFIGALGQFKGMEEDWAEVHRKPKPYVEYRAITTETGQQILPPPAQTSYVPQVAALQGGAEECRRAIMAATGMYQSSVGSQDSAGQSGIAIKERNKESDQGNFHFIANLDGAIKHTGRIIDDLIPLVYDTEREVGIRGPDGQAKVLRLNSPEDPEAMDVSEGDFDVAISVGPSFESEREESRAFVEKLLQVPMPGLLEKILHLLVKLSLTGPIADELVKIITPADQVAEKDIPPAIVNKMKEQEAALTELQGILQQAQAELQARAADNETKERIATQNNETKLLIEQMKAEVDLRLQEMEAQQAMMSAQIAAQAQPAEPMGDELL